MNFGHSIVRILREYGKFKSIFGVSFCVNVNFNMKNGKKRGCYQNNRIVNYFPYGVQGFCFVQFCQLYQRGQKELLGKVTFVQLKIFIIKSLDCPSEKVMVFIVQMNNVKNLLEKCFSLFYCDLFLIRLKGNFLVASSLGKFGI